MPESMPPSNKLYGIGRLKNLPGAVPFYNYRNLSKIVREKTTGAHNLGLAAKERITATANRELRPIKPLKTGRSLRAQKERDDIFIPSHPEPDQLNRWLVNPLNKARFRHAFGGNRSPLLQPEMVFNIPPKEEVIKETKASLIRPTGQNSFATITHFDETLLDPISITGIEEFSFLLSAGLIPLPLYMKPTNSAHGNGVIRLSKEGDDLVFSMVKTITQTTISTEKVESYFKALSLATIEIDPLSKISTFKLNTQMLDLEKVLPTIIHDLWLLISTEYNHENEKENVQMRTVTVETELEPLYSAGTHEIRLYIKGDLDSGKCKLLKYKSDGLNDGKHTVARFNASRFSNYSGRDDFASDAGYDQMLDPFIENCKIPKTKRKDLYEYVELAGLESFRYISERYHSRGINTYSLEEAILEIDLQLAKASKRGFSFETPRGYTQAANIEGYFLVY